MRAIWPQPQSAARTHDREIPSVVGDDELEDGDAPQTQQSQIQDSVAANDPFIGAEANKDVEYLGCEEGTSFGMALFDARNAFCELNRHLMLWNVAHLWNKGSRFLYNCYHHWGKVFVRDETGKLVIIIHSKEGIDQGCVQSMNAYGISILPFVYDMRETIPRAL